MWLKFSVYNSNFSKSCSVLIFCFSLQNFDFALKSWKQILRYYQYMLPGFRHDAQILQPVVLISQYTIPMFQKVVLIIFQNWGPIIQSMIPDLKNNNHISKAE